MNKLFHKITLSLFGASLLTLTSCSEVDEVHEFANWATRNQQFIDSIAKVCELNPDGKWVKYIAYNLNDSVQALNPNSNYYVYIHKEVEGKGTYSPLFNDSIRVHYLGRLIPTNEHKEGYIFGKSYAGETLNETTDVPSILAVNANVPGFATATLHMVEGDEWKIYVPYYLGYGESENSSSTIPGFSTLIFNIKMAKIYRYKIDNNTQWY